MKWLRCGLLGMVGLVTAAQQDAGWNLNERGNQALERGEYGEAQRLYTEAIEVWQALGPAYDAYRAAALLNRGAALCSEGKRLAGAKDYEEALPLHRRSLGPKHLRTLTNLNQLGSVYLMLGDGDRAAALFAEALPVERELYPHDIQLARTLAGLSSVLVRARKPAEALQPAEEALSIALKAEPEEGLNAALMYSNVAEIHRIAGRPERALPLYRKARAIYERLLGPTHARVASILSQEGLILMDDGKLSLAGESMVRATTILAKSCPECDFEQSITESNLGLLRLKQKRYAEADQLLSHALSLQERFTNRPGPDVAATLQALALVREKERLYEDAARLHNRAASILAYH